VDAGVGSEPEETPAGPVPLFSVAGPGRASAAGLDGLRAAVAASGLERVQMVAWRDLDDPEAGGSELHVHRVASRWAAAGLEVTVRTSAVPGQPAVVERDGYRVERRSGRYAVFSDTAWRGVRRGRQPGEGLVEVWNGMPFFSPLWYRGPRIVFLHHVHAEMWRMVLSGALGKMGETVERRVAPPFYRRSRIVTLSASSRDEIVDLLGIPSANITVAPPGTDPVFSPGGTRSPSPLVVAVGRLVPVKRFDRLIEALVEAKRAQPALRAVIIGEGYERSALEDLVRRRGAQDWLDLPGYRPEAELVDWYRRAWVVASASQREGWGMTLTEAAACATPAVATDIAGHRDAVIDGQTGILVADPADLGRALAGVLGDRPRRQRLAQAALERSRWFTWEATARTTFDALAAQVTTG
jgi:glycosyltransferase involved in cell wall biosynthesis